MYASYIIILVFLLGGVASQGGRQTTNFTLVIFNETYAQQSGARCMDGSPAGFYIREGAPGNNTKWILWFQGGGLCYSNASCEPRLHNHLGSSLYQPPQPAVDEYSFETQDPEYNPDFYDWNHVFLFYCTSDLWVGGVTNIENSSRKFYFSGHLIANAVLNTLITSYGMNQATQIIITGSSAGGSGAFYHTDYIANMFPQADVVGVPMAGWAIIGPTWDSFQTNPIAPRNYTADILNGEACTEIYNATEFYAPVCIKDVIMSGTSPSAAFAMGFCFWPPVMYNYISADIFIAQNLFDQLEITGDNSVPINEVFKDNTVVKYLQDFGTTMSKNLTSATLANHNGVWAPACFKHTPVAFNQPTDQPIIGVMTFQEAFHEWYFTNPRTNMRGF